MTRPRLLLAVILTAVVVLCVCLWVSEGPLWRLVMLKTVSASNQFLGHEVRFWNRVNRWNEKPHGPEISHYVETGMKSSEALWHNGAPLELTHWNFDGTVKLQVSDDEAKTIPPWWWGVPKEFTFFRDSADSCRSRAGHPLDPGHNPGREEEAFPPR